MRGLCLAVLLAGSSILATGQIHVTGMQQLPLPAGDGWMCPGWAPDGRTIFLTAAHYRGLYRYDLATGTLAQITDAPGAGYGWAVSPDGSHMAYRKTLEGSIPGERIQEIVRQDLMTGISSVLAHGTSVDLPVFAGNALVTNDAGRGYTPLQENDAPAARASVLGIENTKIVLVLDGAKKLFDPFGDGSYIWPALSPDRTRLVAYDMARGAFVCDLQGNGLVRLGRIDAPAWTRSGAWIIAMHERNDGHAITGSDLVARSPDGRVSVQLTYAPVVALAPACSPVDNRIVCATTDGTVLVLTYEETGR